jgi:hypothetical protein
MSASSRILALRDFGVAFGDRVVLNAVNLEIAGPGVLVLMGPVGTGKSTLLRTIAGINQAVPSFRTWGEAAYAGAPLGGERTPVLVAQNARLLMSSVLENIVSDLPERSHLNSATKREIGTRLLIEAGLESLLGSLGSDRQAAHGGAVSHNQQDALELQAGLHGLAGRRRGQSCAPAQQFFDAPASPWPRTSFAPVRAACRHPAPAPRTWTNRCCRCCRCCRKPQPTTSGRASARAASCG